MKKTMLLFVAAATAVLAAPIPTKAGLLEPALVSPLDTFSVAVVVFNGGKSDATYAVAPVGATFGEANTFTGVGLGGSNVTVASSETIGATITTDTITISTPSDFVPAGYKLYDGAYVNSIEFAIGTVNTLDYTVPLPSTYSASDVFVHSGGDVPDTPIITLTNGNKSLASSDDLTPGGVSNIAGEGYDSYTITISYATVPEPSTYAAAAVGALALGAVFVRRHRPQPLR